MAATTGLEVPAGDAVKFQRVVALLGGRKVIKRRVTNTLDLHEALDHGLPGAALTHLMENLETLDIATSIEKAVGMSFRTFQRHQLAPRKPLSQGQSGRTWTFADILAKATALFGSRAEAEQWLARPAIGLDQRRPIDLLATPAGVKIVEDFLERIEYGVYT